jgi:hypothetical protein
MKTVYSCLILCALATACAAAHKNQTPCIADWMDWMASSSDWTAATASPELLRERLEKERPLVKDTCHKVFEDLDQKGSRLIAGDVDLDFVGEYPRSVWTATAARAHSSQPIRVCVLPFPVVAEAYANLPRNAEEKSIHALQVFNLLSTPDVAPDGPLDTDTLKEQFGLNIEVQWGEASGCALTLEWSIATYTTDTGGTISLHWRLLTRSKPSQTVCDALINAKSRYLADFDCGQEQSQPLDRGFARRLADGWIESHLGPHNLLGYGLGPNEYQERRDSARFNVTYHALPALMIAHFVAQDAIPVSVPEEDNEYTTDSMPSADSPE